MSGTDRPLAGSDLAFETNPEGIRVTGRDGRLHYLNQTAAAVWLLCDGTRSESDIAAEIARLFSLDTTPTADVRQALTALSDRGLLQDSAG